MVDFINCSCQISGGIVVTGRDLGLTNLQKACKKTVFGKVRGNLQVYGSCVSTSEQADVSLFFFVSFLYVQGLCEVQSSYAGSKDTPNTSSY